MDIYTKLLTSDITKGITITHRIPTFDDALSSTVLFNSAQENRFGSDLKHGKNVNKQLNARTIKIPRM